MLVHRTPGTLDGLELEVTQVEDPPAGHLRVRVLAAGMNFRDVLTALGSYPGAHEMGHECCGVVEAIGEGVSAFRIGERVMTFYPGSFQSYVIVPEAFAFSVPEGMDPASAATIPVAFGTAYYALHVLGSVTAEHTVLIHSGAGGVGLAAIQLAQAAGARVFATAGSREKRELLERLGVAGAFDSRAPSFADAVLRATDGAGVDLVLNSLIGEMIPAGLRVLRSGGLFVELGKRDLLSSDELEKQRSDVRYVAFDLGGEGRSDAELLPKIFGELGRLIASGKIKPLPASIFPLSEAPAAFRRMARAEHVGKIVLVPPPIPEEVLAGWVVVTGGAGGVGMSTVRWLAGRGATRVALWGRSATDPALDAELESLRSASAIDIRPMRVDVTSVTEVRNALGTLRAEAPISGVFHAAAVIADATLRHQDRARLDAVLAPKVAGAWNLHEATLGDPLESFVMYSAAGPLIDAKGQANYAAANAFLDSLAVYRRGRGLPGVSVQWGPWSGAGLAARLDDAQRERWTRRGLEWWTDATAIPVFEALLRETPAQVFAVRTATVRSATARSGAAASARPAGGGLRNELETTPASLREDVLRSRVLGTLVGVLGLATPPAVDAPLRDAGLDSLSAIELRNALSVATGMSLPATLAFDHPTVAAICRYLLAELKLDTEAARTSLIAAVDVEESVMSEVDALTEEEAELLLLQELGLSPSTEAR
jgi:NADPH:quinone reductase-like Zn-dependent oxidoreductase/acyl carrier protein